MSGGLTGGDLGIGARPRERTAGDGSGGLTGGDLVGDCGRGSGLRAMAEPTCVDTYSPHIRVVEIII